jgi:FlaG/FlaF family flagellin (archaellin)
MKKFIAVSPIVSMVIVVVTVFIIAGLVVPWYYNVTRDIANRTGTTATRDIECQSAAYDFDTSYGNFGVNWSFTGSDDTLSVKIVNTGTINLYNFSIQAGVNTGTTLEMKQFDVNATTQRLSANPLKPGQSEVLDAVITEDINGTLTEVRVLNEVCSNVLARQEM